MSLCDGKKTRTPPGAVAAKVAMVSPRARARRRPWYSVFLRALARQSRITRVLSLTTALTTAWTASWFVVQQTCLASTALPPVILRAKTAPSSCSVCKTGDKVPDAITRVRTFVARSSITTPGCSSHTHSSKPQVGVSRRRRDSHPSLSIDPRVDASRDVVRTTPLLPAAVSRYVCCFPSSSTSSSPTSSPTSSRPCWPLVFLGPKDWGCVEAALCQVWTQMA
mmetsp:Transcript_31574/g.101351  ORF Transcript_31574/g.101351 Transcript_31574/m.101351 type:complete len:223 (-) Transcript_31574:396-1064(-)